jgi:glycerol uptake facilitator-like aquaporin
MASIMKKFLAELIGTFVFLGVIIINVSGKSLSIFEKAENWLKIGLALSIAILLMGGISGGHFNPAVSVMFYLHKDLTNEELMIYILAQLIGAVLAYMMYKMLYTTSIVI